MAPPMASTWAKGIEEIPLHSLVDDQPLHRDTHLDRMIKPTGRHADVAIKWRVRQHDNGTRSPVPKTAS